MGSAQVLRCFWRHFTHSPTQRILLFEHRMFFWESVWNYRLSDCGALVVHVRSFCSLSKSHCHSWTFTSVCRTSGTPSRIWVDPRFVDSTHKTACCWPTPSSVFGFTPSTYWQSPNVSHGVGKLALSEWQQNRGHSFRESGLQPGRIRFATVLFECQRINFQSRKP